MTDLSKGKCPSSDFSYIPSSSRFDETVDLSLLDVRSWFIGSYFTLGSLVRATWIFPASGSGLTTVPALTESLDGCC